jgi:hypothetical protein
MRLLFSSIPEVKVKVGQMLLKSVSM